MHTFQGLSKSDIESNSKTNWKSHIKQEHNIFDLIYFMIYLKDKPYDQCNCIESQIKKQLLDQQTDFIPLRQSLLLGKVESSKDDEDD